MILLNFSVTTCTIFSKVFDLEHYNIIDRYFLGQWILLWLLNDKYILKADDY